MVGLRFVTPPFARPLVSGGRFCLLKEETPASGVGNKSYASESKEISFAVSKENALSDGKRL
jgi:hypothetical protein